MSPVKCAVLFVHSEIIYRISHRYPADNFAEQLHYVILLVRDAATIINIVTKRGLTTGRCEPSHGSHRNSVSKLAIEPMNYYTRA